MTLPPHQLDAYNANRYPFYVSYQLDAATSMLERTIADFREHLPGRTHDEFVTIALKMVSDEKKAYYTHVTKAAWDNYTMQHTKIAENPDLGPVLRRKS